MRWAARLRPLGRIAWRDARRHRGRSLLVLAMIAIPIGALTMGMVVFDAASPSGAQRAADELGAAEVGMFGDAATLRRIAANPPAGSVTTLRTTVTTLTVVDGRAESVRVHDVPPHDPLLAPRYELLDGRPPGRRDEAVVSPAVQTAFGVGIGDELVLDAPRLRLTITGTVRRPERLGEPFALVPPGTLDAVDGAVADALFLDLPAGVAPEDLPADDDVDVVVPGDFLDDPLNERSAAFGSMFGLAALGLAETGLVVVAAFVVGTASRLRRLGLLAAVGGEPRHARAVVLFEGLVLGAAGSTLGVCVGLLAVRLLSARIDEIVGRVTGGAALPVAALPAAIALGAGAATLAVLGQARMAGRVGIVDALNGQIPAPAPPGRVARWGIVVALVGAGLIVVGVSRTDDLLVAGGAAAMVAGSLMAVPLLVASTGRIAGILPLALRLAARDTARHGRRAGAAVAGAALALALPVAVATTALGQQALARSRPPMAADHILVSGGPRASVADVPAIDHAVRSVVRVAAAAPLTPAVFDGSDAPAQVFAGPAPTGGDAVGALHTGGPELLRALRAEERIPDLRAGDVVVIGDDALDGDTVHVVPPGGDPIALPAVASDGPSYPGLPTFVVAPDRAAEIGLAEASQPAPLLYRATTPVDTQTLDAIRSRLATTEDVWVVGAEDAFAGAADLPTVLLAVTVPIALATLGVSTALVVAEAGRDQAVLSAVGATPWDRRRIMGSLALVLGLMSAVVAIPAGYVPGALMLGASDSAYPLVVPWTAIAVVLSAPLVAGAAGMLLARPPSIESMLRPTS